MLLKQEKVSLVDIEAREVVDDPLHAVPNLPFGHLHGVWKAFLTGLEPGSELWSFRSRWTTQYSDTLFEGYVSVKGDAIGPHFRKSQKSLKVR